MSSLSAEQLRQIAKNRELALTKKRKLGENSNNNACNSLSLLTVYPCYSIEENLLQSEFKEQSTSKPSANCRILPDGRFTVYMPFHVPSIELFKTIPGRLYDPHSKKWNFPLTSYDILIPKLQKLANVSEIPKIVVKTLMEPDKQCNVDLLKIDRVLFNSLLPFQEEGIRFGVSKEGRCLIADDMGLGKTIQALGIAHYYQENWPLLILCPSSMRFPWEEAVHVFLPSVNPFSVTVMTNKNDVIDGASVVICSYDLLKMRLPEVSKTQFGVVIMDESHFLKTLKADRTKAALQIASKCKNVILLSGTPVLSRPVELYPQIIAINPTLFPHLHEFGVRYCDGKLGNYGFDYSGSSNMEELELFLKKKIMIRRLKSDVITQLPSKIRKVIILNIDTVTKQMEQLALNLRQQKGGQKKKTMLMFYSITASAKTKAVCEYIGGKLERESKMLVFAYHKTVMKALNDMLKDRNIDFIRIDGSTSSDLRKTLCDKFQNEENCRVALLSLRAANTGITLTAARLVIFAELYWNPGDLTQAEDRAHRIGQRDSVVIEYLIANETADVYIWGLVQSKLNLLNKVGLSEDCFKGVSATYLEKGNQKTLTSMFQSETMKDNTTKSEDCSGFAFESGSEDDDIFLDVQLEEIENQYESGKKRKAAT